MTPAEPGSPYLTSAEAAAYLRFSTNALYGALRDGVIPARCVCRRGSRLLFDRELLDDWLHATHGENVPRRGKAA